MTKNHALTPSDVPFRPLSRVILAWIGVVFVLFGLAAASSAQEDGSATFDESAEITAIDLVVEIGLTRVQALWNSDPDPPLPKLKPEDFEVLVDGRSRQVVSIDAPDPKTGDVSEPWTVVLYFDQRLLTAPGLAWAAVRLGVVADRLTELGPVDVVVADPEPRLLLSESSDPEIVRAVLSQMSLEPEAGDALVRLRDDFVAELTLRETEMSDFDLTTFAIHEEHRMVQEQHDEMLAWLVDRTAGEGPRRVVFHVTDGFDLAPEQFYLERVSLDRSIEWGEERDRLEESTAALAETLSGYGWTVFPVVPPPDPPPPKGLRIGKWLAKADLKPRMVDVERDPWNPDDTQQMMILNLFSAKRQHQREPERAESYLSLGRALTEQGEFEDAEEALHQAIYHFAQDPRTAAREALAWGFLGDALDRQGRVPEARAALKQARKLDPGNELFIDVPDGVLVDPVPPLVDLATATAGAIVRSDRELDLALYSLVRRVRLTYQMPGSPQGALHEVKASCGRSRCPVNAPAWTRSSIPETVPASRVRQLIAGRLLDGDWKVDVRIYDEEEGRRLVVEMPRPVEWGEERVPELRLSFGYGDPELPSLVEHQRLESLENSSSRWRWEGYVDVPEERVWTAVLVEDLASGRWGGRLVELDPTAGFRLD